MGDPPPMARLDDVAKFATDLETSALICRSSSHVWARATSSVSVREDRYHWTQDCAQCGTTRTVIYTSSGYIVGRRYDYPDGYRREGLGRIDGHGRAVMRVEMFHRMVD